MSLGKRVQYKRMQLKLSQQDLADLMGYSSRSSINKIENGRPVTQKIIVRLAAALKTTPAYLMGWDEEETTDFDSSSLVPVPSCLSSDKRWMDEVGITDFTPDEFSKLIDYANYLISKRKE